MRPDSTGVPSFLRRAIEGRPDKGGCGKTRGPTSRSYPTEGGSVLQVVQRTDHGALTTLQFGHLQARSLALPGGPRGCTGRSPSSKRWPVVSGPGGTTTSGVEGVGGAKDGGSGGRGTGLGPSVGAGPVGVVTSGSGGPSR